MLSGAKVVDAEAARAALRAAEAEKKKREGERRGDGDASLATSTATTATAAGTSLQQQQQQKPQQQREAWLTDPSLARQRRPSPPPPRAGVPASAGIHAERPAGLSAGATAAAAAAAAAGAAPPPAAAPSAPSSSAAAAAVGDGGASWRLKALRRAQQEASAAGRDVREVVEERWGSVAELAAAAVGQRGRRGDGGGGGSSSLAHLHAARDRARALGVEERLAERRAENDAAMGEERPRERDRGGRGREEERRADGDRRGRDRDRDERDERSVPYLSSSAAGEHMRRPVEGGGGGLSWRRRDDGDRGGRGRDRDREKPGRSGARDHGDRDRDRDRGRNGGGSSYRPRRDAEDEERAALLSAAAPSMNAFASDGSFMRRFEGSGERGGTEKEKEKEKEVLEAATTAEERRATAAAPPQPSAPPAPRPSAPPAPAPAPQTSSSSLKASDANRGAAAALRARLGGSSSAARPPPLPLSSNASAPAPAAAAAAAAAGDRREVVDLPLVDHRGRAAPGAFGRAAAVAAPLNNREARKLDRYDADGTRSRYFKGDDASAHLSATELAKRTRLGDDAGVSLDVDGALANAILRQGARYKAGNAANDFGADEEYDADAGLDSLEDPRFSKKRRKHGNPTQQERARAALVGAATREQRALDSCRWCLRGGGGRGGGNDGGGAQPSPPLFFVVAATERAFLAVPSVSRRLVPGQLIIAPARHAPSVRRESSLFFFFERKREREASEREAKKKRVSTLTSSPPSYLSFETFLFTPPTTGARGRRGRRHGHAQLQEDGDPDAPGRVRAIFASASILELIIIERRRRRDDNALCRERAAAEGHALARSRAVLPPRTLRGHRRPGRDKAVRRRRQQRVEHSPLEEAHRDGEDREGAAPDAGVVGPARLRVPAVRAGPVEGLGVGGRRRRRRGQEGRPGQGGARGAAAAAARGREGGAAGSAGEPRRRRKRRRGSARGGGGEGGEQGGAAGGQEGLCALWGVGALERRAPWASAHGCDECKSSREMIRNRWRGGRGLSFFFVRASGSEASHSFFLLSQKQPIPALFFSPLGYPTGTFKIALRPLCRYTTPRACQLDGKKERASDRAKERESTRGVPRLQNDCQHLASRRAKSGASSEFALVPFEFILFLFPPRK